MELEERKDLILHKKPIVDYDAVRITRDCSLTARLMDKCLNVTIAQFFPGTLQVF